MDPRRVLTFRAVAHQRSFSRAARELARSQPSVSNQVAALERELGMRLLERAPSGVTLTRAGRILLEHADAIAERFELAGAQLADAARGEHLRLRIGAVPTALAAYVPAAVAHLRRRHPDSRVTVDEGTSGELPERVRSGELHLAVSFQDAALPRHEPVGLQRRDLLHEKFVVALAPDHPLAQRRQIRLTELSDEDWTAASADGMIVRACRAAGFEPRVVSITRDQLAIRALISRGLAVTIAPALIADVFDDVAVRGIAGDAPSRDVYALLPPGGRHPLVEPTLAALDATAASTDRPT
jgi:DNA-binding transcriptional LysR family regulator